MNDMDSILSAPEDVALHPEVTIASSKMGLTHQHLLDVIFFSGHCSEEVDFNQVQKDL